MSERNWITITAGDSRRSLQLGFRAYGVLISNLASQWLQVNGSPTNWIPPLSRASFALGGQTNVSVEWAAPAGTPQKTAVSGQQAVAIFTEEPQSDVGAATASGFYYDRNPTSFTLAFSQQTIAPHAATVRATYTVPTSRKAFIEISQCFLIFESVGDLVLGSAQSFYRFTPSGGVAASVVTALAQGICPVRTYVAMLFGASIEMQAGDKLDAMTSNLYTASTCTHVLSLKGTEFDA